MTPEQYLARAAELSRLADRAATPELREEYQKLASAWRELARSPDRPGPVLGRWDKR